MAIAEPTACDILLVEDDEGLGAIVAAVLEDQGYRVIRATSGAEALAYLKGQRPPGLILLNLVMPGMNGWRFRDELKRDPELAGIPIVVLSGVRNLKRKAASLGAADSFTKPYNLKELIDKVQQYCQESEQRRTEDSAHCSSLEVIGKHRAREH